MGEREREPRVWACEAEGRVTTLPFIGHTSSTSTVDTAVRDSSEREAGCPCVQPREGMGRTGGVSTGSCAWGELKHASAADHARLLCVMLLYIRSPALTLAGNF